MDTLATVQAPGPEPLRRTARIKPKHDHSRRPGTTGMVCRLAETFAVRFHRAKQEKARKAKLPKVPVGARRTWKGWQVEIFYTSSGWALSVSDLTGDDEESFTHLPDHDTAVTAFNHALQELKKLKQAA